MEYLEDLIASLRFPISPSQMPSNAACVDRIYTSDLECVYFYHTTDGQWLWELTRDALSVIVRPLRVLTISVALLPAPYYLYT